MVSVISSTWMLVGGPGGPDRWRSQAGKRRKRKRRQAEGGKGKGKECKSGRDGKIVESHGGFSTCGCCRKISTV